MTIDEKIEQSAVQRSVGDTSELSSDELDRLNYERKIRDQEAAGRKITPRHLNIAAVLFCAIGLLYAIPRMLWMSYEEDRSYIPLNERVPAEEIEILPPLPGEQRTYLDGLDTETPVQVAESLSNTNEPESPSVNSMQIPASSPGFASQDIEALLPENAVINTVEQWARDWSAKNIEGYLSHYADSFISEDGQNLQAWREYRAPRITSPEWIEVQVTDLKIEFIGTTNAQADFLQTYSASNFSAQSFKRLIFVHEDNVWKIHQEISVEI